MSSRMMIVPHGKVSAHGPTAGCENTRMVLSVSDEEVLVDPAALGSEGSGQVSGCQVCVVSVTLN